MSCLGCLHQSVQTLPSAGMDCPSDLQACEESYDLHNAAQQTSTVTVSATATNIEFFPIAATRTETGYQYSVTSPAAPNVQNITVTPDLATTVSTSTKVYTRTKYVIKVVIARATRTAKCTPTPARQKCPTRKGSKPRATAKQRRHPRSPVAEEDTVLARDQIHPMGTLTAMGRLLQLSLPTRHSRRQRFVHP